MLSALVVFTSCSERGVEQVEGFKPVYGSIDDLQELIKSDAPQDMQNPGKIYVKGSLLLVNEVLKGIHVIDNSDPENPTAIKFIHIPGNLDVAMKGDYIYADYLGGIVTIDITDINQAQAVNFNPNYNNIDNGQLAPPQALTSSIVEEKVYFECPDASKGVVIDWEKTQMPNTSCYIQN